MSYILVLFFSSSLLTSFMHSINDAHTINVIYTHEWCIAISIGDFVTIFWSLTFKLYFKNHVKY